MFQVVTPETVGFSGERLERLTTWMQAQVDGERLPGLSLLVGRRGQVAFARCAGLADVEAGKPVRDDTIFRIYSMSKPVTAVAAMMLYEEGCFQLDDPIARFLPEFAELQVWSGGEPGQMRTVPAQTPITVGQLFTHTAGFTYGFMETTPVDAFYREHKIGFESRRTNLAEMTTRLAGAPLLAEPGSQWNYSVSIDVLGRLVEVWSGQTLDRFFAERIFAPLGMSDTAFVVAEDKLERFAACYGPATGGGLSGITAAKPVTGDVAGVGIKLVEKADGESRFAGDVALFSGGGGLTGTLGDYARFCQMLLNFGEYDGQRLLGRKTVEFMGLNHLPGNRDMAAMGQPVWSETNTDGIGYGLGMAVVLDPAAAQVMTSPGEIHWGGAASTAFWIDPVEDLYLVLMTQLLPSSTYPLRRELRALTYQALID